MPCLSASALGSAYVYASGGSVMWKAVSKTATCGTSNRRCAVRMPLRLGGLCSGASAHASSIAAVTSSVITAAL